MAHFIRGTGSDLTPIQHSASIFKNYLTQMTLKGLFGKKGSGSPIILDDTLKGDDGDTIRYHFIPQNDTDGIDGQNATILGNEDDLDEFYFSLTVEQVAKAFRKKGKMTDQRIIWNFRNVAKMQLQNWFAQRSERWLIEALTGVRSGMTYTWAATTDLVNGAYRCIRAEGANGSAAVTAANSDNTAVNSAMDSADKLSMRLIVDAATMAATEGEYKVQPVKVGPNGEEYFILLVHPKCARDLMFSADWQNYALSCTDVFGKDMPSIASGALGIIDNVIVRRNERILTHADSSDYIAHNLLLGANACVLGWVQKTDYTEELIDHKRILSCAADEIRGQTKVLYTAASDGTTNIDAGVVQVLAAAN